MRDPFAWEIVQEKINYILLLVKYLLHICPRTDSNIATTNFHGNFLQIDMYMCIHGRNRAC